MQRPLFGEDLGKAKSYGRIRVVEDPQQKNVILPTKSDLSNINICGIDGSNQRVEKSTFYFILTRAAIVEFRYSADNLKPYFYNKLIDSNAVVWVDGNVFNEDVILQTQELKKDSNIIRQIQKNQKKPFLLKYSPDTVDKSPSSHALGWAVKLQQTLEMACLEQIKDIDVETVCIKDGPLFSTSVSPEETLEGLNPIFSWGDKILIACSKRVKDSRLLVELLQQNSEIRDYWFPNQNITTTTLKQVSTDSILLPRILEPGYRTPLMEAVPISRQEVVKQEERLMPLTCYYLSRHRPHTYIRIEIPKFMWDNDREKVERAISIVAWQHELGHRAPLVQLASDLRCQLGYEKNILEKQTESFLHKNKLDFPEDY